MVKLGRGGAAPLTWGSVSTVVVAVDIRPNSVTPVKAVAYDTLLQATPECIRSANGGVEGALLRLRSFSGHILIECPLAPQFEQ